MTSCIILISWSGVAKSFKFSLILKGVDLYDHTKVFLWRTLNYYKPPKLCTLSLFCNLTLVSQSKWQRLERDLQYDFKISGVMSSANCNTKLIVLLQNCGSKFFKSSLAHFFFYFEELKCQITPCRVVKYLTLIHPVNMKKMIMQDHTNIVVIEVHINDK